jgi:hypothetical protein
MKQPHSWMEYQYRFVSDNDNNRMWMRDTDRIYQTSNNRYFIAIDENWYEDLYDSFDEAKKMVDQVKNDNGT